MRLPGVFQLRFAERQLTALLFQLPPRMTRFAALMVVAHSQRLSVTETGGLFDQLAPRAGPNPSIFSRAVIDCGRAVAISASCRLVAIRYGGSPSAFDLADRH